MLHEYHVIYSVRYYPRFHVTAVVLGKYYLWIRWHASILYGCEIWTVPPEKRKSALGRGQKMVLREVIALKEDKMSGEWRKIQKKNHINSYQQNTLFWAEAIRFFFIKMCIFFCFNFEI
jgi:hypothetical protein